MGPVGGAWPRARRAALLVAVVLCAVAAVALALTRLPDDGSSDASARAPAGDPPSAGPAGPTAEPSRAALPLAGRTVALDPGHNRDNGRHPGEISRPVDAGGFQKACNTTGTATDQGVAEATVNWELALAVRERLQALGATVVMTRDEDAGWGPCIDERAAIANRAGADLLLSLHADGAAAGGRGFHVIMPGVVPGWTDDIAGESERAAVVVRDALVGAGLTPATYTGRDGLDVRTDLGTLNRADVPAVMLEAGNLRSPGDAAMLTDPGGRAVLADALTEAVQRFLTG
ncbi:N-acetylmuramoyl-L-alanine amidase [Blastococcus saxobsidens]|uniref:N-acetylmuramoyl-L-alanine amidase n=1 Tax=Blastococcus saxobsidens TaxID=138336 RepID=A0A4Q7YCQ4_9ACTN|nr:N-acetylmuramoyl-L-alanine amidase [Blastococcus saxobsidens]RZU34071.1 N-acetylmuramoyl-L-alanine amidase [Blastococcus saxobsidens]